MLFYQRRILLFIIVCITSILTLNSNPLIVDYTSLNSSFSFQGNRKNYNGYNAVARYNDGFIAAGADGRIDRITISGTVTKSEKFQGEKFNCIISYDKIIIAAGDKGTLLVSDETGIFRNVESNTGENINGLALFRGIIIGVTDHGEIISGDGRGSFKKTRLPIKGNIVSVSARESNCYGVTDEGEIIRTADGNKWDIIDFNKVYSGYYKTSYFTKVLVTDNRIAIVGIHNDGSPVLLISTQGNVWTERPLLYTDDQGYKVVLEDSPNDIIYNDSEDMFYIVCNGGKVMQLPSCNQCNKVVVISTEDLEGITFNDKIMMIVGGNFLIKAVSLNW
jgi:hypothetical protein